MDATFIVLGFIAINILIIIWLSRKEDSND